MPAMRPPLVLVLVVVLVAPPRAAAQEPAPAPAPASGTAAPAEPPPRSIDAIGSILVRVDELDRRIEAGKRHLADAASEDERGRVAADLARLRNERAGLEASFARFATGTDLSALEDQPEEKADWQQELFSLITPLLRELKGATAGARNMDRLKIEIGKLESRLPVIDRALASTATLRADAKDARVSAELDGVIDRLRQRRGLFESQLTVARRELSDAERARKPFTESAREVAQAFFADRGRNLGLALVAMVGVFVALRMVYRFAVRLTPARRGETRGFAARLVDVLAYVLAGLGSFGALVGVLYASGDWVLLSLASILILGLVVTARTALPRVANEILFLLNLGTVRENERLLYEGLPWRVVSLRFSAVLENPELDGARLSLPIRELLGRYSRPIVPSEPWFPTRKGDTVQLADGSVGRVACQTAEVVVIETDRARVTYLTAAFLGQGVRNLSGAAPAAATGAKAQ